MDFLLQLLKYSQAPAPKRVLGEWKMHFLAIFYFNVFNNCVVDFCTAWLWQPELFNTITDKLIDNFIENINIENIQISKFGNFNTICINHLYCCCTPNFLP